MIAEQHHQIQKHRCPIFKKLGGNERHHYPHYSTLFQWPPLSVFHFIGSSKDIIEVRADE